MAIIKCKMCGGDMDLTADQRCGTCEYCGSTMTLPKVDDEQRAAAFNRGNHFRRIGEFDKALTVYERIVQEDDGDAEAHWCCALCRFGIEYVKDPASGEYLPTCHRASFDSFLEDVDYKAALEHADAVARRQYQKDGQKIAQVQRGILAVSQKEQPFDVFICYKECDEQGNRTVDSTLAQDIYYHLTDQGYRVFFSRITLEDKAGQAYEPYIFAALHSAKVMVVVGTKPEYLNAVWVKNEWSRYLTIVKSDRKKLLIPCYRDMDPYDMPEQLSVLQSYDMSKIGFIQDLIRGISKVLDADKKSETKETVVVQSEGGANFDALLKRGYMALEDKSWQKADEFFEQVLNMNAECAEAYVGKLLALLKQPSLSKLVRQRVKQPDAQTQTRMARQVAENRIQEAKKRFVIPGYLEEKDVEACFAFDLTYLSAQRYRQEQLESEIRYWNEAKLYQRALSFAGEDLKKELQETVDTIIEARKQALEQAKAEDQVNVERIKQAYLDHLEQTKELLQERHADASKKKEADRIAKEKQVEEDRIAAEKQHQLETQRAAKNKKVGIIAGIAAVCLVVAGVVFTQVIIPENQYKAAEALLEQGDFDGAISGFESLNNFKDSKERASALKYDKAIGYYEDSLFEEAEDIFDELEDYKDSQEMKQASVYGQGELLLQEGNFEQACWKFSEISGYKDSSDKFLEGERLLGAQYFDYYDARVNYDYFIQIRETLPQVADSDLQKFIVGDWVCKYAHSGFSTESYYENGTGAQTDGEYQYSRKWSVSGNVLTINSSEYEVRIVSTGVYMLYENEEPSIVLAKGDTAIGQFYLKHV